MSAYPFAVPLAHPIASSHATYSPLSQPIRGGSRPTTHVSSIGGHVPSFGGTS